MKLVWNKTGDFITCNPVDPAFVEFWLSKFSERIWANTSQQDQTVLIDKLQSELTVAQEYLSKLKILKLFDCNLDCINQSNLNSIHRNWVLIHQQYPNIYKLFDERFRISMYNINKVLHAVEESWHVELETDKVALESSYIPNTFGRSNITIPYENLGRSTYNKWLNFDNVDGADTNNFREIYGKLTCNLHRNYSQQPPEDYVIWAKQRDLSINPSNLILLANFNKLDDNLHKYRELFLNNFVIERNYVIFTK
jgi:hypothetical protein